MKNLAEPFSDHTHKAGECGFCGGTIEVIFGQSVTQLEMDMFGKFRLHSGCVMEAVKCLKNGGIRGLSNSSPIRKAYDEWVNNQFQRLEGR